MTANRFSLTQQRLDALDSAIASAMDVSLALSALARLAGHDDQPDIAGALSALSSTLGAAATTAAQTLRPGGVGARQ